MKSFCIPALSVSLLFLLLLVPWKIHCHPASDNGGDTNALYQDTDDRAAPPTRGRNAEETGHHFEGDIVIADAAEVNELEHGIMSSGRVGNHYRWPRNTVPYEISSDFSLANRHMILKGMNDIEKHTCLRFKAKISSDKHFIKVVPGNGCSSFVGRQSKVGGQAVTLDQEGCMHHGIIMHELIHALGFWHEQSRTDRDDYVQILLKNIKPGDAHNFEKYTTKEAHDFGVPYDFSSLMHYRDDAFILQSARKLGKKTIVPNIRNAAIGQRRELSKYDVLKLNRMYNCPRKATKGSKKSNLRSKTKKPQKSSSNSEDALTQDLGSFYIKVSIVKKLP